MSVGFWLFCRFDCLQSKRFASSNTSVIFFTTLIDSMSFSKKLLSDEPLWERRCLISPNLISLQTTVRVRVRVRRNEIRRNETQPWERKLTVVAEVVGVALAAYLPGFDADRPRALTPLRNHHLTAHHVCLQQRQRHFTRSDFFFSPH